MYFGHRQTSSIMIGKAITNFVISKSGKIRTAQDVKEEFHRQYGIDISCHKACRAHAYVLDQIRGSAIEPYALLPIFAH